MIFTLTSAAEPTVPADVEMSTKKTSVAEAPTSMFCTLEFTTRSTSVPFIVSAKTASANPSNTRSWSITTSTFVTPAAAQAIVYANAVDPATASITSLEPSNVIKVPGLITVPDAFSNSTVVSVSLCVTSLKSLAITYRYRI